MGALWEAPAWSWADAQAVAWQWLAVWLVGLVLGWLLPKPKWVDRGLKAKALLMSSPPGLWFRRVAVAAHLSLIVREVWRNLFAPGTFRAVLRALWRTLTTGERFSWPQPTAATAAAGPILPAETASGDSWYVGAADLVQFKWTIEEDGRPEGASDWELMMEKQWPGCSYTAWRRTLPSGKSEYKSITVAEDSTAEEFMDFYLDDETRCKWDSMLSETHLLESGDPDHRCQVVRWVRTFPMAIIAQREYVIARRLFREQDGSLYAITKGIEHSAAPRRPGVVRMEDCHSHWRSRTVACPRGTGRPACETVLLHYEDFRINERLARFAVRHGMAGFVKSMIPAVERFVVDRRLRCEPYAQDPASFGRRQVALLLGGANAALARTTSLASQGSCSLSACSSESVCSQDDSASDRSLGAGSMKRSSSMRRLGAMMLASGVAIAIARTASGTSLAPPPDARSHAGASGRHSAGGKRHGGSQGGSSGHQRHGQRGEGGSRHHGNHGHGSHSSYRALYRSRSEVPPRPRRRQAEEAAPPAVQA